MANLTLQQVESFIVDRKYIYDDMLTICIITCRQGFKVVGTSGCFNPDNYNQQVGMVEAEKDAMRKLFECAAFYMKQII